MRAFFDDLFSNPAYQPLDLTPDQVFGADELRFNRDPFDALIVAAAQTTGLPLVTRDGDIRESGTVPSDLVTNRGKLEVCMPITNLPSHPLPTLLST